MAMPRAKRDEGRKIGSDINVTPMVDVMLVLLIIFMVVTPLLTSPGMPVDMAKTEHPAAMPGAAKDDSIVLAVTRDGKIYLGRDQVGLDQLRAKVTDRLERSSDRRVFVKADAHASYGQVVEVVDNLRSANVENLGLLTEERRASSTGKKAEPKT
jgi:biopolymer transport protein ExbD/biopolymer transport protein TolR